LAARPCNVDSSGECRAPITQTPQAQVGLNWEEPTLPLSDPKGLFWRLDLNVSWHSDNPFAQDVVFEVHATKPCAKACTPPRLVEAFSGSSPLELRHYDVFLQAGETGIELQLRPGPGAVMQTAWGAADIEYLVEGNVSSFHAVGDPVVLPSGADAA
jgi:hypothetical protein